MLQDCRRILQLGDQMLLDAPDVELDDTRALDALVFTAVATANVAAQPASSSAASSAAQPATSSATHPVGAPSSSTPQSSAAQPVVCESEAEDLGDNSDTAISAAAEDADNNVESLEITTLKKTTSLHDDWLHRGAFLADLDLYSYIAPVSRLPRPTKARISDTQRCEHVFLFDDHYELAK